MVRFKLILLIILGVVISNGRAQEEDGAHYLKLCNSAIKAYDGDELSPEKSVEAIRCVSYIKGFLDGHSVTNLQVKAKQICLEEGFTIQQVVRLFVNTLRDNPKVLNNSGRAVLFAALKRDYPCPK